MSSARTRVPAANFAFSWAPGINPSVELIVVGKLCSSFLLLQFMSSGKDALGIAIIRQVYKMQVGNISGYISVHPLLTMSDLVNIDFTVAISHRLRY